MLAGDADSDALVRLDEEMEHFPPETRSPCGRGHSAGPGAASWWSPPEEGGVAMRVYLKAVAITVGLLGAWLALLPLVA